MGFLLYPKGFTPKDQKKIHIIKNILYVLCLREGDRDGEYRGEGSFIHDIPYPDDTIHRVRIIIYVYISLATIQG